MQPALLGLHGAPELIVWQRCHGQQSSIMRIVIQDEAVVLCSMAHRLQLTGAASSRCGLSLHGSSTAAVLRMLCQELIG